MNNIGGPLHNKPEYDSIPTPRWFFTIFEGFYDPFPLGCKEPIPPKPGQKVFVNPGYSRKELAADLCIEWHKQGCFVVMLVPIETSTQLAKKLLQYGVERMYFDRRIFPNCRGVELLVLTGS